VAGSSTVGAVLQALAAGRAAPVYLLVGDDEAAKAPVLQAIEQLVDEADRGFNVQRFYANDARVDVNDVVAAARTLPFLGGTRVVIVLHAEAWFKRGRPGAPPEGDTESEVAPPEAAPEVAADEFEAYLANPVPETCLAVVASDVNRATRLGKQLLQRATVVEFWGVKPDRDLRGRGAVQAALEEAARLVARELTSRGLSMEEDAVERLVAHAGTDAGVLRADLDRVFTYAAGRPRITEDDVRAVVAGQAVLNDFAAVNAMTAGDCAEALRQVHLMLDAGASPYALLGQCGYFVRAVLPTIAPEVVPGAVRAVFEADLDMKTSRGEPQVLLERLIVELCGAVARGRGAAGRGARRW
jgi:DNA polymerase III delta subunit